MILSSRGWHALSRTKNDGGCFVTQTKESGHVKESGRVLGGALRSGLQRALDEGRVHDHLTPIVKARYGKQSRIKSVEIKRLQRRVVRYTIVVLSASGDTLTWRLIGKIYVSADMAARAIELSRQVWDRGFATAASDKICIAEPVDLVPELAMVLMGEVPGEPHATASS